MLTILIPMCGDNNFGGDKYDFPKPLIDIMGIPMIEWVIKNFESIVDKKFIFIVNENDCRNHHLDSVLKLLSGENSVIIKVDQPTQGAACTALLAIEHIDNETPLLISNSDHVIDWHLQDIYQDFLNRQLDGGVVCFPSVHPKWSYARVENMQIIETAEKRPISRNAIAGIYYFSQGNFFVNAAMKMIERQAHVNQLYFLAPALNELILEGKLIGTFDIPESKYHHFYEPNKIQEFERQFKEQQTLTNNYLDLTKEYIKAFNEKNLDKISLMLSDDFVLEDPIVKRIKGKSSVLDAIKKIFENCNELIFSAKNIYFDGTITIIEFELQIDDTSLKGTDVIEWSGQEMKELRAYFDTPKV
jgi:dTDP-glucose pyrophosphorylase